jgi:hypothetical protein
MNFPFWAIVLLLAPFAAAEQSYFQQRVKYNIKADLDPETARLSGTETIFYYNNSPDTLIEVYFHLYYNAFQPNSYMDRQARECGDYYFAYLPPDDWGYTRIDLIKNAGARIDSFLIDNTIMRVPLFRPLGPGDSTYFYIEWTCQIPAEGARAAHSRTHFDVGQWYPKIAAYDRYGWHADQYLWRTEFFADFGDLDVELTLPENYIVAHCGRLLNEHEVFGGWLPVPQNDSIVVDAAKYIVPILPDTSLSSGIEKAPEPAGDTGNIVIQNVEKLKTWQMRANNIHDFAFSADPDFIIDVCRYKNATIKSYYTRKTRRIWERRVAESTRKAIALYSDRYFPWPYDQYSTVNGQVDGGIEYPDLTILSAKYSATNPYDLGLDATIAHEVAHAWFYGILGFNETDEAFLDEGLTSFATIGYMEHYHGRFANNFAYPEGWRKMLLPNGNQRNDDQGQYIRKALSGTEDPIATPAARFSDDWTYYNASYHKAASVYLMLQQAMGDDKFSVLVRKLFERWAFKHPYFADFKALAEEIYDDELDWFFDQWFRTTWTLDYALDYVRTKRDSTGAKFASIGIANQGRCVAPLDVVIDHYDALPDTLRIPVDFWLSGVAHYDTTMRLTSAVKKVTIDPGLMLADVDRLDNSMAVLPMISHMLLPFGPVTFQFLIPRFIYPYNYVEYPVDSYHVAHNPTLWYNSVDGAQAGYAIKGAYLEYFKAQDAAVAVGLQIGNISYRYRYENPLTAFHPQSSFFFSSKEWEGRGRQEVGLSYSPYDIEAPSATWASVSVNRNYLFDDSYLSAPTWSPGKVVTAEFSASQKFGLQYGETQLQGNLSISTWGSDYSFDRIAAGALARVIGIGVRETRISVKAGRADGEVPLQRRFFLSEADPYDTWESPFFRSRGTLPEEWKVDGHLFKPGGAGLFGYLDFGISGTRMLAGRISNDLPNLKPPIDIPFLSSEMRKIKPEVYFAGGRVWSPGDDNDKFLFESGFVFSYRFPKLDLFISENSLSLCLPLWLSNPADGEKKTNLRWLFSLSM